jgi:exodeoxyribonuclease-5
MPQPAPIEVLHDHYGPPLETAGLLRGGAQALAAQAACPLAAFARYRLGAEAFRVPPDGPDASQRGTLLHLAMAQLWQDLKDHATLVALDEAALQQRIDGAVGRALEQFESDNPGLIGARLKALEHARLATLICDWLGTERQRAPFALDAAEAEREVELAGFRLKLKLDRLDRVDDGGQVIIDYKTGKADLAALAGERLLAPQLPLYAVEAGRGGSVSAIGFARLRVGESEFHSVAADPDLLPRAFVPGQPAGRRRNPFIDFADLPAVLAHWNTQLDTLAQELASGFAANQSWVEDSALRWQDAWPLLRRVGPAPDEDGGAGEQQ